MLVLLNEIPLMIDFRIDGHEGDIIYSCSSHELILRKEARIITSNIDNSLRPFEGQNR